MLISVARIQKVTAHVFKVDPATMTAKNNRGEGDNGRNRWGISRPRQVAMYLSRKLTRHSTIRLGQLFGGRDHSTIIHAVRAVEQRLAKDPALRAAIENIRAALRTADEPIATPQPTAPKERPNWYSRQNDERREDIRAAAMMRRMGSGPRVRDEDRVYRDPCIKCGTRGDIGCIHTRVAA